MTADIGIVGGGIIGCAIAYELAKARAGRIVVFERGVPGAQASGAAAGVLAVSSSRAPGGVLFDLKRRGIACFPTLVEALRAETGIDVEYRQDGLVEVAFSEEQLHSLATLVQRRRGQGFHSELLTAGALREREPQASEEAAGAAFFPDDHAVNNARLVEALRAAAERRGVEIRCNADIDAIERADGRVAAVSHGGRRTAVGQLVIAAGAWSRALGELLRVKVPVRPDRGEMAALLAPRAVRHTLAWGDGYLVPRRDGEVLVGSTSTRNVWDCTVSARSLSLLLSRAVRMVPALGDAPVVRAWAGLRPLSTIRRPIIDRLPGYANVLLATGHHRNGIVLAPITGRLVAEWITRGETSISLQPFCYRAH